MGPEAKVQKEILKLLDYIGGWSVKTITVNKAGCPDILYCYKGRFIAIEVKEPGGGVVKDLQRAQIRKIRESGGIAMVAHSRAAVAKVLTTHFPELSAIL